jgi:hypothetical protein
MPAMASAASFTTYAMTYAWDYVRTRHASYGTYHRWSVVRKSAMDMACHIRFERNLRTAHKRTSITRSFVSAYTHMNGRRAARSRSANPASAPYRCLQERAILKPVRY